MTSTRTARRRSRRAGGCSSRSDKFYGLRTYTGEDCEGHRWTFESALSGPAPKDERWKRREGRGA